MATHDVNIPSETPHLHSMPLAPGNAKASEPAPKHVTAQGPLPKWLDPAAVGSKFTKAGVAEWDRRQEARAGTFAVHVSDVQADEAKLRQASSGVRKPRGLR